MKEVDNGGYNVHPVPPRNVLGRQVPVDHGDPQGSGPNCQPELFFPFMRLAVKDVRIYPWWIRTQDRVITAVLEDMKGVIETAARLIG